MDWAAALFSLLPLKLFAVRRPFRGCAGAGEGDMRTTSASVLGCEFSLLPWPCPPRLPWCLLPLFAAAAEAKLGKASGSSAAGADGVDARECDTWRLLEGLE